MELAIVLGSHTVGLGIARALGSKGIPIVATYHDSSEHGYVSRYVDRALLSPHPENHEDDFIRFLLDKAERLGGSFLIPASDATLAAVSRHKDILDSHYVVAANDWETTQNILDKKHTYALAERVGVPAPRTVVPHSVEDAERYAETALYPCLVKPSQGHRYFEVFGRKMVKADDRDQMLCAYREATEAGLEVMLQEFIPGDPSEGVNYNAYSCNGGVCTEFTAAKIRNAPRDTGSPCAAVSKEIPEVLESGRKILQAVGYAGYACTEFKRDPRDGVYKLMEVNGRHNLSTLLAVRCGINFPWLHYEHLMHGKPPTTNEYQTGVYWIDIVRDLSVAPHYLLQKRYPLRDFARPYFNPHVNAILDRRDLRPFAKRCLHVLGKGLERLVPRD
jgi:D-aspartate ligase